MTYKQKGYYNLSTTRNFFFFLQDEQPCMMNIINSVLRMTFF